jgi:small GTP-binding protein
MINRYISGTYIPSQMTIGTGFAIKNLMMDGITITLSIWDFAGEERFRFLVPRFSEGANGCILAFDSSRPSTFFHLEEWIKLLRKNVGDIPIMLVGTKCDLAHFDNQLVKEFVDKHQILGYISCSAKDDVRITEIFELMARVMLAKLKERSRPSTPPEVKTQDFFF